MTPVARKHEPDVTRLKILTAAAEQMHLHGYQAASMSVILDQAGVTKGALYHHFENKQALGYAVLDEVVGRQLAEQWIAPVDQAPEDVIQILKKLLQITGEEMSMADILVGCPLNNLAQEMSPIDAGFRIRINALYEQWSKALEDALVASIGAGKVKPSIDPESTAIFIVASMEGCVGLAKQAGSRETLISCGSGLVAFLDSLKT